MLAVRKRNTRIRNIAAMLVALMFSLSVYSQYSLPSVLNDSLKTLVIQDFHNSQNRVTVQGLLISRYDMPIFCKWELDIQDQTKFPVKFRLGSQEYVDRLEQKNE